MSTTNNTDKSDPKDLLAGIIARYVPIATGVLGICGLALVGMFIYLNQYEDAIDTLKYVFASLLPLWGTWLGTVLAFYFSKQNFEAANRSVRSLVETLTPKEKLEAEPVESIMMKFSELKGDNLKADEVAENLLIVDVINKITKEDIKRWPIFKEGIYQYILHKSTLDDHLTHRLLTDKLTPEELSKLTIQDMIDNGTAWTKQVLKEAAGFLAPDASLYDAKKLMDASPACNDVFVTKSGKADEQVLGWVSNVDVARVAKF